MQTATKLNIMYGWYRFDNSTRNNVHYMWIIMLYYDLFNCTYLPAVPQFI